MTVGIWMPTLIRVFLILTELLAGFRDLQKTLSKHRITSYAVFEYEASAKQTRNTGLQCRLLSNFRRISWAIKFNIDML
jgi:hypothetical protein